MKRAALLTGGILLVVCIHAQVRVVDMSVMRARHAVDTLVQNDQYLDGRTDSLTTFIDPADSTATFTTIDVDSINARAMYADTATVTLLKSDSVVATVLDYEPPHGAMAFSDSASTLDLTVNTWAHLTNSSNDLYTSIDADGVTISGDSITIDTPGDYLVWVGLSFNGSTLDFYHCAIHVNDVITPFEMHRKTSTNDTGNMGMPALLDNLAIGDGVKLKIQNTANNNE
jgi:hypothetical protein